MSQSLKEALSHIVWIGGATDSGKTTIATKLAERHQWQTYHFDQYDRLHHETLARDTAVSLPFYDTSLDERWLKPEPEELLKRTLLSFMLRFPLVIEDLLALSANQIIIAEGFGLLPEMLTPLLSNHHQAIWLTPTEGFKWASMTRRNKPSFAAKTSDPEKAKMNLFMRDMLLANLIRAQTKSHAYEMIEVDGSRSIEEMVNLIDDHFSPFYEQSV